MKIDVITIFPNMIESMFTEGVVGNAVLSKKIKLNTINPRKFTKDIHHSVDDRPYGGGAGMVMSYTEIEKSFSEAEKSAETEPFRVYLTPQGKQLNHNMVKELSKKEHLILLCGRYEGVDERIIKDKIDLECSIGDFVLSGGELAAGVVIDSVARLLPEVLGHIDSANNDSFATGLLDCPHYTRPETVNGKNVPEVLLSGNHKDIETYRLQQSLGNSWIKRPDLFAKKALSKAELGLLNDFLKQYRNN